jgi:hypothetical protein
VRAVLVAMRVLLELAFAVVALYAVISVCIDGFLMFGVLRAGAEMYMDMKTPTVMQLAVFQFASLALIWLLVAVRRWVMQKI